MSTYAVYTSCMRSRHRSGIAREIEDRTLFRDSQGKPIPNFKIVEEINRGYEYFWSKRPADARPNNKSHR